MSVVPTGQPEELALRQALEAASSNEATLAEALARRFAPADMGDNFNLALERRFGKEHSVTDQDILDFSQKFPMVTDRLSQSQISDLVLDGKRFPQGRIGGTSPKLSERLGGFGRSAYRVPEALVGGAAIEVARTIEMLERGTAVVADLAGLPDLSRWYRDTADSIENFNEVLEGEVRGPQSAKFIGGLAAIAAPSAASLAKAGGATKTLLMFFGLQAAGAGDKEIQEFGIEPGDMRWFTTVAGYAAAEVLTERIGLNIIGRMGTKIAQRAGAAMLKKDARQVAAILFEAELISDVEGAEEALTQWLQNSIAKSQFDSERKLTEGLVQSFFVGKALGGLLVVPAAGRRFQAVMSQASEGDVRAAQAAISRAAADPEGAVQAENEAEDQPTRATAEPPETEKVVSRLSERGRAVAERAAIQATRDKGLTTKQRKKAREILAELETTRAEGAAIEEVRVTPAEIKAFLQETGLQAIKKGVLEESQELENRLAAERRAAAVGVAALSKRVAAVEKAKGTIDLKTRRGLRRLVRAAVPPAKQGRFMRLVEKGTAQEVRNVIEEIDFTLADEASRATVKELRSFEKAVKKARLRGEDKTAIQREIDRARQFLFTKGNQRRTLKEVEETRDRTEALRNVTDQAEEALQVASEVFAEAAARETGRVFGELVKIDGLIEDLIANVDAPDQSPLAEDNKGSLIRRLKRQQSDIRNIGRTLEGKHDNTSVIEQLLFGNMIDPHDAALIQMANRGQEIDQAAKRAGFKSLADAQSQLSRRGGRGVTQRVKVEIGEEGEKVNLTLGEALWFMAIDLETEALILAGAPVKLAVGKRSRKVILEEDDLAKIRAAAETDFKGLPQRIRDFVADVKEIANQDFAAVQSVVFELTGREPPAVPDYFRRRRDAKMTETRGLPEGFRGVARRYAENLGFTRKREGGLKQAILVEDFLDATLDHIRQTAIVQHIAQATRTASAVLLSESVQTAITAKHGSEAVDSMLVHLEASSLANPSLQGGIAQAVRFLNGSLAVAKLSGNPTSWMRQLGGIPRLAPFLGTQTMSDGLNGWHRVTLEDLTSRRGFFWDRYVSNIAGRFSPVEAVGVLGDESSFRAAIGRAGKNFVRGDLISAVRIAREANMSLLQILNSFDAINAKIAYAGYLAEVERAHPKWDLERRRSWAARQAEMVMRETQNSSSVLDMPTIGLTQRGKFFSLFLLFRSDTFKALNRIRRAVATDRVLGTQVIAAETANIIWSRTVSNTMRFAVGMLLASLGIPRDESEETAEKVEREFFAFLSEFIGATVDPIFIPQLIDMRRFAMTNMVEAPAIEAINDLARALDQAILRPPVNIAKGELDKALDNFLKGMGKLSLEAASLAGLNPLDAMMRRIMSRADTDENADLESLTLP